MQPSEEVHVEAAVKLGNTQSLWGASVTLLGAPAVEIRVFARPLFGAFPVLLDYRSASSPVFWRYLRRSAVWFSIVGLTADRHGTLRRKTNRAHYWPSDRVKSSDYWVPRDTLARHDVRVFFSVYVRVRKAFEQVLQRWRLVMTPSLRVNVPSTREPFAPQWGQRGSFIGPSSCALRRLACRTACPLRPAWLSSPPHPPASACGLRAARPRWALAVAARSSPLT